MYVLSNIFGQANKCNEIGWLFLLLLDKVEKDKDELRGLSCQPKHCINDWKTSTFALKDILISYSCRAEIAEN